MSRHTSRESELSHLEAVSWGEEVDSSFLLFGEMPVRIGELSKRSTKFGISPKTREAKRERMKNSDCNLRDL